MKFSLKIKLALYRLGIGGYALMEHLAALFGHQKAKKRINGLSQWQVELRKWRSKNPGDLCWIHAASLGEYEMALPLMDSIRNEHPETNILLSFYSPSGYERCHTTKWAGGVFYLPADTQANVQKWLKILEPKRIIFIKYEIWLNYLFEAATRDIPMFLVNAAFLPDQRFFTRNSLFLEGLKAFNHIFVQYDDSQKLLMSHGLDQVTTTGDLRFERVTAIAQQKEAVECIANFKKNQRLLVGGSTWAAEEKLLAKAMWELPDWKLAIFPHEFEGKRKTELKQIFKEFEPVFWSDNPHYEGESRVYIIDTVGLLSRSYLYADVAVVGGGFSGKLHNILEPLAFGVPVMTGPKTERFEEAQQFQRRGLLKKFNSAELLKACLMDNDFLQGAETVEYDGPISLRIMQKVYS